MYGLKITFLLNYEIGVNDCSDVALPRRQELLDEAFIFAFGPIRFYDFTMHLFCNASFMHLLLLGLHTDNVWAYCLKMHAHNLE